MFQVLSQLIVVSGSAAAGPRRDWGAVRTGLGMAKKCADFVRRFGRKDMLEFAGLLFDFRFAVHGQAIGEETLCEAVPADNAASAFEAARREFDNQRAVAYGGGHGF